MNKYIIIGVIALLVIIGIFFFKRKSNNKSSDQTKMMAENQEMNAQEMQQMQQMLAYDIRDEPKIMQNIKNMEMNEIKIYADKLTKENVTNKEFLEIQFPEAIDQKLATIDFSNKEIKDALINPTVLGNAAYIASNSMQPYKDRAARAFNFLFSKV